MYTLRVSADFTPQVPRCWPDRKGLVPLLRPGFLLPELMQSQVQRDWIGAEAVFHSPEVLRSRLKGLVGTLRVSAYSASNVPWCWRGPEGTCDPHQTRFTASLINAVSGPM